jgi:hypothetical protein
MIATLGDLLQLAEALLERSKDSGMLEPVADGSIGSPSRGRKWSAA